MTNLEKISNVSTMAELLYDTDSFDTDFCYDCQLEDGTVKKEDCMKCIKEWLEKEVSIE